MAENILTKTYRPSLTVGQVYARPYGSTAAPTPIGNVLELDLEHDEDVQKQDDMTRMGGGVHAEVRRIKDITIKMKLADLNVVNLTRAVLGTAQAITGGTVTGEELTVMPGTWHRWWNAGDGEVRIRATVEPALDMESALLVFWGLCADGHTNAEGRPSPLFGAMLALAYRRELRLRPPPDAIQRLLFPPLAAIGRRRGLQRTIDRYLDLETHPSAEAGRGSLPESIMRRES